MINGKQPGFPCMGRLTEVIARGDSYLIFTVSLHLFFHTMEVFTLENDYPSKVTELSVG